MSIRNWSSEDLPDVNALLAELSSSIGSAYHGSLDILTRHFIESERHPDLYSNWVYVHRGGVAGLITAVYYSSPLHRKGTALINELVVSEKCRRRGIGRKLLQHCVDDAAARGFDEVEVGVEKANTHAIEFYKRNGIRVEYTLLGKNLIRPA